MHATVIASMYLASSIDRQAMLSRIEGGINNIFHNPTDAFYTGRALELLFDGIELDCSSKDTYTAAICAHIAEDKTIKIIDDDHLAFAVMGNVSG